eukprot:4480623-Karenia_brevis.AAC.1
MSIATKRANCTNNIAALNSKSLPIEEAQLRTWLRGTCKPRYWANVNCRKKRQSKKVISELECVC